MKKKIAVLTSAIILLASSSVTTLAAPAPTNNAAPTVQSQKVAPTKDKVAPKAEGKSTVKVETKGNAKSEVKGEAKKGDVASTPQSVPVAVKIAQNGDKVAIGVAWDNTQGEVRIKEFPYNAAKQQSTFIISPVTLSEPEQNITVSKGIITGVRTRKVDSKTIAIDIISLNAPSLQTKKVGTNGWTCVIDTMNIGKAVTSAPKAPANVATQPAPTQPKVTTVDNKATDTQNAVAAPAEPIPVSVKVNLADEIVSFDVNWEGKTEDVKVKEFAYNPAKQMHTFIFTPAVLATPEETIKVNKGIVLSVRTRKVDNKTIAVDIMALNDPTVKKKERTSPGVSYTMKTADMEQVMKDDSGDKPTEQTTVPAVAPAPKVTSNVTGQTTPAQPTEQTTVPAVAPAPKVTSNVTGQTTPAQPTAAQQATSNVTNQTTPAQPVAAPKVTSNINTSSTAAKANGILPSDRVCDYFTMAGRDVLSLVESMKGLFPNVRFQADPVLNVILVEGTATDIAEVRKLINVQ